MGILFICINFKGHEPKDSSRHDPLNDFHKIRW